MVNTQAQVANIGPEGQKKRLQMALVMAALVAAALVLGMPRAWRPTLFVPIWFALLGVFQALDRTCVWLASRGRRDMGRGDEEICDEVLVEALRSKARSIYLKATAVAAILTAIGAMLPF